VTAVVVDGTAVEPEKGPSEANLGEQAADIIRSGMEGTKLDD
jgi:mRNA degradation ribonuclease J1/J2